MNRELPHTALSELDDVFVVARFDPTADVDAHDALSVTRTERELSIVCPRSRVPVGAATDGPWTAFYTDGTIAFDTTGIVAGLTLPLANIQCPVFVISTFDGDLILVPTNRRADAITAWTESGHTL